MDIWEIAKVVARRWLVTVPLLLLTFGAMAFIAVSIKPDYTATGNLSLLDPSVIVDPQIGGGTSRKVNPWNTNSLTDAAIVRLRNKAVHDQVAEDGYVGEWEADTDLRFGSVITIKTTAPTKEQAQATTRYIMDIIAADVKSRQAQYKLQAGEEVTTIAFDNGDSITTETGKMKRTLIAVFGIGLILSATAAIGYDSFYRRRNPGLVVPTYAQQRAISLAGGGVKTAVAAAPAPAQSRASEEKPPSINVKYLDADGTTDQTTIGLTPPPDDSTIIMPIVSAGLGPSAPVMRGKDKPQK